MRNRETAKLVLGSLIVYVVVAACGGGNDGFAVFDAGVEGGRDGGKVSDARREGAAPRDSMVAKLKDAITDPVKEAMADTNASGSRLKVTRFAGSDGSSVFLGLYDSHLKTPCAFTAGLSDSSTRCTPTGVASTGAFFSDSMCTVPLATVSTCAAAPTYANGGTAATCTTPATTAIHSVTGPWTGLIYSTTGKSDATDATCALATSTTTMAYAFYSIGASEIPPTSFVAGTFTIDP